MALARPGGRFPAVDMESVVVRGTFAGHVLPGSLFVVWALYWVVEDVVRGDDPGRDRPLEAGGFVPAMKVVIPLVGVWVEIPGSGWPPGRGWPPVAILLNWQHVTMYTAFCLSGVVDLLVRRGIMSSKASYLAFAGAALNAGLLFWGHGRHGGVPGVVHSLLAILFLAVACFAVAEMARPSSVLAWLRRGALLALGGWFIVVAWILYRSGWDMADPVREGWSYMLFSWNAIAASVLVLAVRLVAGYMQPQATVTD